MMTGLLATPEYARASVAHSPADTSKAVAGKLERQAILYDTSKTFRFLLTEQAVRWPVVEPLALAEQIDRLVSLTHMPNVRIGIIPVGTRTPTTAMNTFTVYDASLVTVETHTGSLVLRDDRDVRSYLAAFSSCESCAIFGDCARAKLAEWSAGCRSGL